MAEKRRQEVLNVKLAELLTKRGIVADAELILTAPGGRGVRMPDVLVTFRGLRIGIECEVDDQPRAGGKALRAATRRVEDGISHLGLAVVYPATLRTQPAKLESSELRFSIVSEAGVSRYVTGTVDSLGEALRHAFDQLVKEDAVTTAAETLDRVISVFAEALCLKPAVLSRLASELRMKIETAKKGGKNEELVARQSAAVSSVTGLVLANAMMFNEILAGYDERVLPLESLASKGDFTHSAAEHWQMIISEIDYYPIFHIAHLLLVQLASDKNIVSAVLRLVQTARELTANRTALRHDLMGRIYHRLLAQPKYQGTFFTRIPSATLLLGLVLSSQRWELDWSNRQSIRRMRIADLACGTGTLLMAAADSITDNHIRACAAKSKKVDLPTLHRRLAEDVLYGYDVELSALHLTGSTLAMRAPGTVLEDMHLRCLELGGKEDKLGSIEFLVSSELSHTPDLFRPPTAGTRVAPDGSTEQETDTLPDLDVAIMNPPFTRSVGDNLLFGTLPDDERERTMRRLRTLVKEGNVSAQITAGLGAVFVAVADKYVVPGGRMGLVLPKSVLSGVAWSATRDLLREHYVLEDMVCSHDPTAWNFSESTSLSEVLLVLRRARDRKDRTSADNRVNVVNLWRNPETVFEALGVCNELTRNGAPDLADGQGALTIRLGEDKFAEVVSMPWKSLAAEASWMLPASFAQADLLRAAHYLLQGRLWLPGRKRVRKVPMRALGENASIGPDRRDIHDGFDVVAEATQYPALWGHDANSVRGLETEPNAYLAPLGKAKKGRPLRKVTDLWPKAGQLLIAERLRLNSQRVAAIHVTKRVLSNTWWPVRLSEGLDTPAHRKALVLWLNSTPGLIAMLAVRTETEGPWVEFKKPTLAALPVLDISALDRHALQALEEAFDQLPESELMRIPDALGDDCRCAIDSAISSVLSLPDFTPLREMLVREPVVSAMPIGRQS